MLQLKKALSTYFELLSFAKLIMMALLPFANSLFSQVVGSVLALPCAGQKIHVLLGNSFS